MASFRGIWLVSTVSDPKDGRPDNNCRQPDALTRSYQVSLLRSSTVVQLALLPFDFIPHFSLYYLYHRHNLYCHYLL